MTDSTLQRLLEQVSEQRLIEYVTRISSWQRLSGSGEEREAFDYIESLLRGFGLEVRRFAPICLVSLPVRGTFKIIDADQEFPAITHSFSTSTDPTGIEAEVVYAGAGNEPDYQGVNATGKIVLLDGLATPNKVAPAERHGALGAIHISGRELHEMIISPVWGSPTPDTVDLLPKIPHISIHAATGDELKRRLARGPVRVRLTTEVDTGWRPLPLLVAMLPPRPPTEEFVLFSGHVDSWYFGAMDNGTANAAMIEIARILSQHRDAISRGVWWGFWSGHSHARYATSAWFADQYWQEIYDSCVAHVNVDSPGAKNATVLSRASSMAETLGLARELIGELSGQELSYQRIGRMGDQSFWGIGVPSLYNTVSEQEPSPDVPDVSALLGGGGPPSGGPGWWWHTPDDTLDKVDGEVLTRDTRILLATIYRLSTDPIVPLDVAAAATEIRQALREIVASTVPEFELEGALTDAERLVETANRLNERIRSASESDVAALNRCLIDVSRLLVPVNYTTRGPYEQDLALGSPAVPGLRPAARLAALDPASEEFLLLLTKLRRERARVLHALRQADRRIEATLGTPQAS